jgi:hypothetical protein
MQIKHPGVANYEERFLSYKSNCDADKSKEKLALF